MARVIRPARDQALHLGLIKPQPLERIQGSRQRLQRPRPLADHGDQLLTRVSVRAPSPQQLGGPGARGHPERHQRLVPVRPQASEQLIEFLIGDLPRDPPRHPRPVPPGTLSPERIHRVAMRIRPAPPATGQRERIHHRPGTGLQVKLIKTPQHRLAVRHRGCRIPRAAGRLTPPLTGHPRLSPPPVRSPRLASQLDPAAEVPRLCPGRLIVGTHPAGTADDLPNQRAERLNHIQPPGQHKRRQQRMVWSNTTATPR